ncbi:hypothetical protein FCM35_KLT21766 [Carex littledalei]|uniref:Uncharacterized protein n=1 Tax=Carex littledalei TaxID=544730 RepID=A0A833QF81_9POAL|nr:hypothetical protein FCM35_KLT21766 [Carex littledalei]
MSSAPWRRDDDESEIFKDTKMKVTRQLGSDATMHVPGKKSLLYRYNSEISTSFCFSLAFYATGQNENRTRYYTTGYEPSSTQHTRLQLSLLHDIHTHASTTTLMETNPPAYKYQATNPTGGKRQEEGEIHTHTPIQVNGEHYQLGNESMRVFLPPRGPLRTVNSFLERSAMVLVGPHQITRYLAHRLTVKLANYFNLQPRDFHVSRVNQNYGDFIVRFPNASLRDHVHVSRVNQNYGDFIVRFPNAVCVFTLGPDV